MLLLKFGAKLHNFYQTVQKKSYISPFGTNLFNFSPIFHVYFVILHHDEQQKTHYIHYKSHIGHAEKGRFS
jgi:hypothetical protein